MTIELPTDPAVLEDPSFRQVLDAAPIGVAIGRLDGKVVYVNAAMCRILGREPGDITVGTFVDAAHPEHQLRVRVRLRSIESGEFETFVRETRFQHGDGTVVNARFHVGSVRNPDGTIAFLIAHAEDITEERRTETALAASEERLRAASEASLDSLVMMDAVRGADGTIVDFVISSANENSARLFGVPVSEMIGKEITRHFPPGYEAQLLAKYTDVVESGRATLMEYPASHPRVRAEWIREQIVPVGDGLVMTASDITEPKRIELELRESEERFQALLQHAVDVVCIADAGGFVRYVSSAVEHVLGYSPDEFLATHPFDLAHPDDLSVWMEHWQEIGTNPDARSTFEVRARHRDGGDRWMEVSIRDLREDPRIDGFVIHFHDISRRRQAQEALVQQTLHDGLTGLPNRALLLDRLAHACDRSLRDHASVAALFLDLDRFKEVNDTLGHGVGDALLREVAQRLRAAVRPGDTVARLGGDEFVICCDGFDEDVDDATAALAMAGRVQDALRAPFSPQGHSVQVGSSIGVAVADPGHESPEEVLRNADTAMYVAKARGRDRVVLYDDALRRRVLDHLDTEAGLRNALERGEFVLHWQPCIHLGTGAVTGVEALVRWQHEDRGLLLPSDFLAAASLAGLDATLGVHVIDQACRQFAAWDREGLAPPRLWLNLAPSQLAWPGTVEHVRDALHRYRIDASRVGFDIAETAIAEIDRARRASAELAALRDLGCAIAIDDFGTGHASPLAVRRYGITHVKLDRSLVQTASDDDPMLPALMSLATMLGVSVIAEGVETPDQLERIRKAGCTEAAGNHLGEAVTAESLSATLAAGRR